MFLSVISFSADYSLKGVVIDKYSREPVAFATVSIFQGSKFTTTDTLGRFTLDNMPTGGAISSVLDFKLKDGDPENNTCKFTIGASEAGFSSNGHLSKKNKLPCFCQSLLSTVFVQGNKPLIPRIMAFKRLNT